MAGKEALRAATNMATKVPLSLAPKLAGALSSSISGVEADGKINETQYQLVSHGDAEAATTPEPEPGQSWGPWALWRRSRGRRATSYYPRGANKRRRNR